MTQRLTNRIEDFVPKAITRLRELTVELRGEYDYKSYQSDRAEELLVMTREGYEFVDVLANTVDSGLTEDEIENLIDFFIKWLELNKTIPATYANIKKLSIQPKITVEVPPGGYALVVDLQAEINARIAGDQALNARIDDLEDQIGGITFPPGFFDGYVSTYQVVFDDDVRLHTHDNKDELDQIDSDDILNIKALQDHYESNGSPGGLHLSTEDRENLEELVASAMLFGGVWNWTGSAFPVAAKKGTLYIAGSGFGGPGDPVFVPTGKWFISLIDNATTYAHYSINI